jgi:septal ring factor EnvC (AmiA/AmiB activator)
LEEKLKEFLSLVGVQVFLGTLPLLGAIVWAMVNNEKRFDQIDKQFDQINKNLDRIHKTLDRIDATLIRMETRIDTIAERLAVENRQQLLLQFDHRGALKCTMT